MHASVITFNLKVVYLYQNIPEGIKDTIMDLREDIKRATKVNPSYGSSCWHTRNRRQVKNFNSNERRLKNIHLQLTEEPSDQCFSISKMFTCESEVISNVIEANGGIDYSNESIERHLRLKQYQKLNNVNDTNVRYLEESISTNDGNPSYDTSTSSDIDVVPNNINVPEDNSCPAKQENEPTGIQMFSRNALISGLIKNDVIRMEDLHIDKSVGIHKESSSHCPSVSDDSRNLSYKNDTASESESLGDYNRPILVPHPDEPDFFGHPLHIYGKIDEQGIDFTIPSCGVKKTVTPRQFFMNIPENSFAFVSKKRINKSS